MCFQLWEDSEEFYNRCSRRLWSLMGILLMGWQWGKQESASAAFGSNQSGVYMLVGHLSSPIINFSDLEGLSVSACMLSRQSCPTLCDPMTGSSVHGILQARMRCHFLFQGIFSTQGSNSCLLPLLHWQVGSLPLAPTGASSSWRQVFLKILWFPLFLWVF